MSEISIERTIEDEILREKVRAELARGKDSHRPLWKFLNSSFGIWLLSSVMLSGLAFVYTEYQQQQAALRFEENRITSLREEIAYRLDQDLVQITFDQSSFPSFLDVAVWCLPSGHFTSNSGSELDSFLVTQNVGGAVPNQGSLGTQSAGDSTEIAESMAKSLLAGRFIHEAYRDRSIFSLIWELKKVEDDPAQIALISEALDSISSMRRAAFGNDTSRPTSFYLVSVASMTNSWSI